MATGTLGSQARDYNVRCIHYLQSPILSGATGGNFNSNTASITLGVIPAGASIVAAGLSCSVVFNATTTTTCKIGTTAGASDVVASLSLAALGYTAGTVAASANNSQVAADTTLFLTNTSTGAVATTGTGVVSVQYIVGPTAGLT